MSRYTNSLTQKVFSAIGLLGSTQAVSMFCSVVRTKFIALWLGPVGVGFNSILVNGANLISTISQLNIRESSVRDIASISDKDLRAIKCRVVRRWALISGVFGAILMLVAAPFLSMTACDGSFSYSPYFAALAPFVFFSAYAAGENAIMQAENKLQNIARANVVSVVFSTTITIFLLYLYGLKSIVAVINIYAISTAVTSYIWRVKISKPNLNLDRHVLWKEGRSFIYLGASMSFSTMLALAAQYAFAAYINSTGGESDLGLYQSGYTLVSAYVGIIFTSMALEYYPRLSAMTAHPRRTRVTVSYQICIVTAIMMPIIIIFISASDLIVKILYSSSFTAVIPYVNFAIIGTLFRGISCCFAYQILAAGDSKAYLLSETLSTSIGLALNIWAYSHWSLPGLGISYIVWYIIYTLITATICHRRYNLSTPLRHLWLVAIAVISGFAAIILKDFFGWWMPLCVILPWIMLISYCLIFRKNIVNGKSNAMV